MDIEQLKLILETLAAAGDGAMTFALLWLAKEFLIGLGCLVGFVWLANSGLRIVAHNARWERIANEANTTLPLSKYDTNAICDLIRKGRAAGTTED